MSEPNARLALLKTDLGLIRLTGEQPAYLSALLTMAASSILREGIALDENSIEDDALVAMYAAWLYRKRDVPDGAPAAAGMPRMLRWQLNCRLASQKMGAEI